MATPTLSLPPLTRAVAQALRGARRVGKAGGGRVVLGSATLSAGLAFAAVAQAAPALNGAWIAQQSGQSAAAAAGGRSPLAGHNATLPAQQIQKLNEQARLSIANLGRAAQAAAQAAEAQRQAREDAIRNGLSVPDGLAEGGLKIDTNPATAGWRGADAPVQTLDTSAGKVKVDIKQTESKAILNWETFNVGKNTHVAFDQQADWAVLNRVNDPSARPSQIQGQVTGNGTVMIMNRNGVIFSGSSQVSTGNLVAAASQMTDTQFDQGIYSTGNTPTLATVDENGNVINSIGDVIVEAGARIATQGKSSVLAGGGYVLLAGREVHNAGSIDTPDGQAALAAGDAFYIRKGYGTEENQASTTRGNEVSGRRLDEAQTGQVSQAGKVENTGIIQAARGDVTLTGHDVRQDGVALATSSVHARGTIHLLNSASDAEGRVTLSQGSVTAVLVEDSTDTALDAQRDALIADSKEQDGKRNNAGVFDNLGNMSDRKDLSRIEIVSGGVVVFEGGSGEASPGSLTLSTGGQIAVDAKQRVFVADGAQLDASGATAVKVSMEKNNLAVNIQGYEQRDAPVNRDTKELNNENVWVDVRDLILVPAGTNGYETDRYYTQGGLLEVSGYLGNVGSTAAERAAVAGTIRLGGAQVIAQQGSQINLAGGSLVYQDGLIRMTWLEGYDGNLYELTTAPGDMPYKGLYGGYRVEHERWGVTNSYYNLVLAPTQRMAAGYVVGRDGGSLVVDADTAVLEGTLHAGVLQGEHQGNGRVAGITDGYKAPGNTVARGGRLVLNGDTPRLVDVKIGDVEAITQGLQSDAELAGERVGTAWLDSVWLKAAQLGGINLTTSGKLTVDGVLEVNPGGEIALYGGEVEVTGNASLVARGGSITVQDYKPVNYPIYTYYWAEGNAAGYDAGTEVNGGYGGYQYNYWCEPTPANCYREGVDNYVDTILQTNDAALAHGGVRVAGGARIDTRGLWANASLDEASAALLPYINGGAVKVSSSRGLLLEAGSVIDASAGGGVQGIAGAAQVLDAHGGEITLAANHMLAGTTPFAFDLHATLRSLGTQRGGKLVLSGMDSLLIGDGLQARHDGEWVLPTSFFAQGFSAYELNAFFGVEVAENTQLAVVQPVLRATAQALTLPTGADAASIYEFVLPELFQEDAANGRIVPRQGASLSLRAVPTLESAKARLDSVDEAGNALYDGKTVAPLTIGKGASITVDPGESVHLEAWGQLTIDGSVSARGGSISAYNTRPLRLENATAANDYGIDPKGLSVWVGNGAVLDASGIAYTAVDGQGQRYGLVGNGGSVRLGHDPDASYLAGDTYISTDAFIVVRPDAVIDVSGARAVVDRFGAIMAPGTSWGSDGGEISFSSYSGTYAEGLLKAQGGSGQASGGTLRYVAHNPIYPMNRAGQTGSIAMPVERIVNNTRTLWVTPDFESGLPEDWQPGVDHEALSFGNGTFADATRVSVAQIERGGFASLVLNSEDNTVLFDGGVNLDLARSLAIRSNAIGLYGGDQDVTASIGAAYVRLEGTTRVYGPPTSTVGFTSLQQWQLPSGQYLLNYPTRQANELNINAGHLDVVGITGTGGNANFYYDVLFDRSIAWTNIHAAGDVRIVGKLFSENNMRIAAAQIYPEIGKPANIGAGQQTRTTIYGELTSGQNARIGSVLEISRSTDDMPGMPYSTFGTLTLEADVIRQGGILRAPNGSISIGKLQSTQSHEYNTLSSEVTFLPGSLTSVSGAGLVIPYGGSPDNMKWYVDGVEATGIAKDMTIEGLDITIAEGAVVDLSAGGDVTGASFVSGRGGSTDVLVHPLLGFAGGAAQALTGAGAQVYAIVPGYTGSHAPGNTLGHAGPPAGRQIVIGQSLPGLPAGTYTLLPANYALLPGAFRVELGEAAASSGLHLQANGSWLGGASLAVADTSILSAQPVQVLLTAADTVRRHSQYNETTLSAFTNARALESGSVIIGGRQEDAGSLSLVLRRSEVDESLYSTFSMLGDLRATPAEDGLGGTVAIYSLVQHPYPGGRPPETTTLEIRTVDAAATPGMFSLTDADVMRLTREASTLVLGGHLSSNTPSTGGTLITVNASFGGRAGTNTTRDGGLPMNLVLRSGTEIGAARVFLVGGTDQGVVLEPDAVVSTLGYRPVGWDSRDGVNFINSNNYPVSMLVVSNDWINFNAFYTESNTPRVKTSYPALGGITIGSNAAIYTEGSLTFNATGPLELADDARFGGRILSISSAQIHIGTDEALADANLAPGWHLNTSVLDKLLRGDTSTGAPAVESLVISGSQSINFIGSVELDTFVTGSAGSEVNLIFNTPGFYGWGDDTDVALIRAGSVYLNGLESGMDAFAPPMANGVGTGTGRLVLDVDKLTLGYSPDTQTRSSSELDRLILGFSSVDVTAASGIDINTAGSLTVYQRQENDYIPGQGFAYREGVLNITTPYIRTESGIEHRISAGSALNIRSMAGEDGSGVNRLGGALTLASTEGDVLLDTHIYFPSGQLTVQAQGDVRLGANARIDLAGGLLQVEGQEHYAWGGTFIAESAGGNIVQDQGAVIDVSSAGNKGGLVRLQALDAAAGGILLNGSLLGAGAESYDGGGLVASGQSLGDLAALNRALNDAGFDSRREFIIKQGDVLIDGDWLRANSISVSADGGDLTVSGRIDASGARPGTIRLASTGDLTLVASAVLDASSHVLQVDAYGQPIEASNRAVVALTAGEAGVLKLANGARIDVNSADGVARGTVDLTAARRGGSDLALELTGGAAPAIVGARSIALNAWRGYAPADGVITQALLDGYHADSTAFINAALASAGLRGRLNAFETAYGDAVHLRPAVQIDSSATADGNLMVLGDIDLARYRYGASANPAILGSGEPGVLTLRAAGDLKILGSISDGFGVPLMDSAGRSIGNQTTPRDLRPHVEITLAAGTTLTANSYVLEYDLPVSDAYICRGCVIPMEVQVSYSGMYDTPLVLAEGTILAAGIRLPDGTTYQRGQMLDAPLELPAGTILEPGWAFEESVHIAPLVVPAGTNMRLLTGGYSTGVTWIQAPIVLGADVAVQPGQLIPAGTTRKVEGINGNYPYAYTLPQDTVLPQGTIFRVTYEQYNSPNFEWRVPADVGMVTTALIPAGTVLESQTTFLAGGSYRGEEPWVLNMPIYNPDGSIYKNAGDTIQDRERIPNGVILPAGFETKVVFQANVTIVIPAGEDIKAHLSQMGISQQEMSTLSATILPAGTVLPPNTTGWSTYTGVDPIKAVDPETGSQGKLWATAPMLPAGSLSWSMNLVSGADLAAADHRVLQPEALLAGNGRLLLSDTYFTDAGVGQAREPGFSVLRTGTGNLELLAGTNYYQESLYGVYTAGTQATLDDPQRYNPARAVLDDGTVLGSAYADQNAVAAAIGAYYPEHGGNLLLSAQGDISGRADFYQHMLSNRAQAGRGGSIEPSWWLWRAGDGDEQATSWWINFGNFAYPREMTGAYYPVAYRHAPSLVGFAGIGTLGGGNLTVQAGGSLGMTDTSPAVTPSLNNMLSTSALSLVVGSSGRVQADGTLVQTGGGTLTVQADGAWNPGSASVGGSTGMTQHVLTLYGGLTNTRGAIDMDVLSVSSTAYPTLILGDSYATLNSLTEAALGTVLDAGRTRAFNAVQGAGGDQLSWFSLWTPESGISLFSAGTSRPNANSLTELTTDKLYTARLWLYPATFKVYSGGNIVSGTNKTLELAPAASGQLELVALGNISGGSSLTNTATWAISGADPSTLATPWQPGAITLDRNSGAVLATNYWEAPANAYLSLFNFGLDTTSDLHADDKEPVRIIAGQDISGISFGAFGPVATVQDGSSIRVPRYAGAKPAIIRAGRDIVSLGVVNTRAQAVAQSTVTDQGGSLFTHLNANDVSVVSGGRDIRYANAYVTGPGMLEVSAGRHVNQGAQGVIKSLGLLSGVTGVGGLTGGADVVVMAGVGASGLNYGDFARLYFDAANQANLDYPLGHEVNVGKVAHTYQAELAEWLGKRYGWSGSEAEALTYFLALPAAQQGIFARQVYFQELQASGREYNDPDSLRYRSYLRGRAAIATLFPLGEGDAVPSGDITLYSALVGTATSSPQGDSGIHTKFGGNIEVLAPYGQATFGLPANPVKPGQNTGVITHGTGDIRMYTQGSIILGESRIFTTFGGAIQMWANTGDINAGMGPKSTIVYAPLRRVYDAYGNVALSPVVPSTGAGLATLAPIPEVPPGDMDLIAPEGVIDAGEAGIRVSGDLNVAALQILNADNIDVKGKAVGLPEIVQVDVGALTDGSRAAAAAVQQMEAIKRSGPPARSAFDVEVLQFGEQGNASQECPRGVDPATGECAEAP